MQKPIPAIRWLLVSVALLLLAGILSFPGVFGLATTKPLLQIETKDAMRHSAKVPEGVPKQRGREILFPEKPIVLEDGVALARPDSTAEKISNAGRGRYQINSGRVDFSTSDAAPIGEREISIRSPLWSLPEFLILPIWIVALIFSAISIRMVWPDFASRSPESRPVLALALTFVGVSLAGMFLFPAVLADSFFLGLAIPSVWAVAMGALTIQRRPLWRATAFALALLPALAGFFYYGLNGASNNTFLVGGIIPQSDARIHFLQAAEIAIQGTTPTMFNGRFLYPAFHSVLLNIAGLNVLLANLIVSSLMMIAIALTCRLVAKRVGFAGTAVYCFLFWLYFRTHGCGLMMTENLGLLLGVVGFGFLLLSVDRKSIWLVFTSIVFLGLALVARPGAMFVLPALALYAGLRVWSNGAGKSRLPAAAAAFLLGMVVIGGCFAANNILIKSLSRGEAKTFGNFAFTLHGLLNDTTWSTSANEFGWDSSLVMKKCVEQIKESPMSLVRGVWRAYSETFKRKFLFQFGEGKRFASAGMMMFFLAAFGCLFWRPLQPDSGWILLSVAAIFASIPFAPPWDAAERPYAATEAIQIFLVAAGLALLVDLLWRVTSLVVPEPLREPDSIDDRGRPWGLMGFGALCFFLVLPAPLLLSASGLRPEIPNDSPALLPGSHREISLDPTESTLTREEFLDRLSDYQESHPEEAKAFTAQKGDFILGIDWRNLETVIVPLPPAPLPAP